jgi:DNA-binding MarR family transcriptional regulator
MSDMFPQVDPMEFVASPTQDTFGGLARFRFALREFLRLSEAFVRSAGVTSQQYQAMLAIRASEDQELSIKRLAFGMSIKQNGAVQLVDRLETQGLVRRRSCPSDRRSVLVSLTEPGDRLVVSLAEKHARELLRGRTFMVSSLLSLGELTVSSEEVS